MGIIDRLGNVIRSYLNDDEGSGEPGRVFHRENRRAEDPDLRAAYAELDEFLQGKIRKDEDGAGREAGEGAGESKREGSGEGRAGRKTAARNTPPESLRSDFAELGLPFGAGKEECRAAYKRLLKLHHPDRHAGRQGNIAKATKKTARINAAYDRIKTWQEGT
jgi:DnaJ-domain-containing protein 1